MQCPFCFAQDARVLDSRLVNEGFKVRRRRQCIACSERFTTYETALVSMPQVIKSDGRRVSFNEDCLRRGIEKALEKRPVRRADVESAIMSIMQSLRTGGEREVASSHIGELVMRALCRLDQVAYVRFASVYRRFEDINAFREEIQRLQKELKNHE